MMNFTRTIDAIDAHTAGEPIRVVTSGIPKVEGRTMLEKMEYFASHYDNIRCMLLKERAAIRTCSARCWCRL